MQASVVYSSIYEKLDMTDRISYTLTSHVT